MKITLSTHQTMVESSYSIIPSNNSRVQSSYQLLNPVKLKYSISPIYNREKSNLVWSSYDFITRYLLCKFWFIKSLDKLNEVFFITKTNTTFDLFVILEWKLVSVFTNLISSEVRLLMSVKVHIMLILDLDIAVSYFFPCYFQIYFLIRFYNFFILF